MWGLLSNIMSVSQTTISKKQRNQAMQEIIEKTSTLSQVVKVFGGLYSSVLECCNGLTVEEFMSMYGVHRPVDKNGNKKPYSPISIMNGWHEGMKKGKTAYVFKNVCASYTPLPEDIERWGLKSHEKSFRVFTKEEAEKLDGQCIKRRMLVEVGENNWSIRTIMNGLKQGDDFKKEDKKREKTESEWESYKDLYVVRIDKNKDGVLERQIIKIKKELVEF